MLRTLNTMFQTQSTFLLCFFPPSVLSVSFVVLFLLLFHLHNHFVLPVRMFIINHRKINVQFFERLPCLHSQLFSSVFFPFWDERICFCFCCYFICTTTLILHVFAYMNQHFNSFPAKALLPLVLFQFINGPQYTLSYNNGKGANAFI